MYDDMHMGDSIGVVVHYTNETTQHTPGGVSCATAQTHISIPCLALTLQEAQLGSGGCGMQLSYAS